MNKTSELLHKRTNFKYVRTRGSCVWGLDTFPPLLTYFLSYLCFFHAGNRWLRLNEYKSAMNSLRCISGTKSHRQIVKLRLSFLFVFLSVQSGSERSPPPDIGELGGDQDHRLWRKHRQPVSQTPGGGRKKPGNLNSVDWRRPFIYLQYILLLLWKTSGLIKMADQNKNFHNPTSLFLAQCAIKKFQAFKRGGVLVQSFFLPICSYFLSTEGSARRRQLFRYVQRVVICTVAGSWQPLGLNVQITLFNQWQSADPCSDTLICMIQLLDMKTIVLTETNCYWIQNFFLFFFFQTCWKLSK